MTVIMEIVGVLLAVFVGAVAGLAIWQAVVAVASWFVL
jgi:hypothetical protein